MQRADITGTVKNKGVRIYLDRGCGPLSWMAANLAAILTGSLFVVELQLFCSATMVVSHRLCLLSRGLIQQLQTRRWLEGAPGAHSDKGHSSTHH